MGFVRLRDKIEFGPVGAPVVNYLKAEWLNANLLRSEFNILVNSQNDATNNPAERLKLPACISTRYLNLKIPFGMVEINEETRSWPEDFLDPSRHSCMRLWGLVDPKEGEQEYFRFLQSRKRWWRQFARDISRISISEGAESLGSGTQEASIVAAFPWGQHCLERITFHSKLDVDPNDKPVHIAFSVRGSGCKSLAKLIESASSLEMGALTYLCDSFQLEREDMTMTLHRKLAPFKIAFAAPPTLSPIAEELVELCKMIGLGLKQSGLLPLLPGCELGHRSLSTQLAKLDSLSIPLTLIVTEETLSSGLASIRNKNTSLQEDVHIEKVIEYTKRFVAS